MGCGMCSVNHAKFGDYAGITNMSQDSTEWPTTPHTMEYPSRGTYIPIE